MVGPGQVRESPCLLEPVNGMVLGTEVEVSTEAKVCQKSKFKKYKPCSLAKSKSHGRAPGDLPTAVSSWGRRQDTKLHEAYRGGSGWGLHVAGLPIEKLAQGANGHSPIFFRGARTKRGLLLAGLLLAGLLLAGSPIVVGTRCQWTVANNFVEVPCF